MNKLAIDQNQIWVSITIISDIPNPVHQRLDLQYPPMFFPYQLLELR
jgi:hypothetical protein